MAPFVRLAPQAPSHQLTFEDDTMTRPRNRQVLLARRPDGKITPADFEIVDAEVPTPRDGQLLLRNVYLSIDPYLRGRMNDAEGSYAEPFAIGAPMGGGTVAEVVQSSGDDTYRPGDLVVAQGGWQEYAVSDAAGLRKLPPGMAHPSHALGVLGMTGFTAWHGLLKIGEPEPGETLVVAAASGAVGSMVGQIATLKGCRVVGIAGGSEKCRYVVDELGFDACVDHRDPAFPRMLTNAVPDGVDIYFENVGGAVFDAVWPHLNVLARVPVCGLIANYEGRVPDGRPDRLPDVALTLIMKRIRMQGFIMSDHLEREHDAFTRDMSGWLAAGEVRVREDIASGLEQAPDALMRVLSGRNFGKMLVRV